MYPLSFIYLANRCENNKVLLSLSSTQLNNRRTMYRYSYIDFASYRLFSTVFFRLFRTDDISPTSK